MENALLRVRKVAEVTLFSVCGCLQPAHQVGPDLGPTPGKYCSAIVAGDGSIFAPPYNARKILRIDGTGNVSLVPPDLGVGPRKYCCICQGANRLLYAPPLYADQVLEISTSGKGNRLIGPAIGNGEAKYACAALGPDDKIYCAPLEAHRVLLIIPEDHEVEEIGVDLGKEEEKYSCIAPAPVGPMMYAAPRNARFLLEVDTKRCFVREVGKDLGPVKRKFTAILTGKPPEAPAGMVRSGTAPQRGAGASWSPPSSRSKQRTPPQDQKAVGTSHLHGSVVCVRFQQYGSAGSVLHRHSSRNCVGPLYLCCEARCLSQDPFHISGTVGGLLSR
ncbi:unnamed protein product [Symbiodinium sp. CCMP2456]|nr:unnamed protein product [Symbiodinium sp. CCMP2456]